ncbi:MAG: hypothetical protein KJ065_20390 [Anaerolineae bacterium]|nr:hypothetical protein [Anaerolineae bacterium]
MAQVIKLTESLSALERVRLIEHLAATLENDVQSQEPPKRRSLYGILAEFGSAPSAEEIDEARAEMWKNFPREDI